MPIAPALPLGGLAGFRFLQATYDRQFEVFNKSPDIQREIDYFLENAGDVISAEDITSDRRLLKVVLGAFGLDDDLNKQAFVRKVIEEGTLSDTAFAKRLVEPAYREMAEFLGIGNLGSTLSIESNREEIVSRYRERQFEVTTGEVDFDMRMALNFERRSEEIAQQDQSDRAGWLALVGSAPLRSVLEGALGLPTQFALIDLDQQVDEIQRRSENLFGSSSPSVFLDPEVRQRAVERFLLNQEVANGATSTSTRGAVALNLLQSSGFGTGASTGLFQSRF